MAGATTAAAAITGTASMIAAAGGTPAYLPVRAFKAA
jgi:hypothetical protein